MSAPPPPTDAPTPESYRFFVNEEWQALAREPIGTTHEGFASLRKFQIDSDDEPVRVMREAEFMKLERQRDGARDELAKLHGTESLLRATIRAEELHIALLKEDSAKLLGIVAELREALEEIRRQSRDDLASSSTAWELRCGVDAMGNVAADALERAEEIGGER